MAVKFRLVKNNIKSNKGYGKYHAHTVRGGEVPMELIEQEIQDNCSAKASDVRMVLRELYESVRNHLQMGEVVNLGEMGKLYLSVTSIPVDDPKAFRVDQHIKGFKCNYIPYGKRVAYDSKVLKKQYALHNYVQRGLTMGCKAIQEKAEK